MKTQVTLWSNKWGIWQLSPWRHLFKWAIVLVLNSQRFLFTSAPSHTYVMCDNWRSENNGQECFLVSCFITSCLKTIVYGMNFSPVVKPYLLPCLPRWLVSSADHNQPTIPGLICSFKLTQSLCAKQIRAMNLTDIWGEIQCTRIQCNPWVLCLIWLHTCAK